MCDLLLAGDDLLELLVDGVGFLFLCLQKMTLGLEGVELLVQGGHELLVVLFHQLLEFVGVFFFKFFFDFGQELFLVFH